MKKTSILFILVILVAVAGLVLTKRFAGSTHENGSKEGITQTAAVVPFTTLAEGQRSKVTSRADYLIETQADLTELWKFLEASSPVPQVDFTTHVVAAVFAGQVPTAGYEIAVAAVQDADHRLVKVQLTKPGEGCVLAQSVSAPYQIVQLPKTSLPFTHDDIWTTTACQ